MNLNKNDKMMARKRGHLRMRPPRARREAGGGSGGLNQKVAAMDWRDFPESKGVNLNENDKMMARTLSGQALNSCSLCWL